MNYEIGIDAKEPERMLFLAVTDSVFFKYFEIEAVKIAVSKFKIKIVVFDPEQQTIVQWKK